MNSILRSTLDPRGPTLTSTVPVDGSFISASITNCKYLTMLTPAAEFYSPNITAGTQVKVAGSIMKPLTTQGVTTKNFSQVYQNTGTTPIFVCASYFAGTLTANTITVYCDNTSIPSQNIFEAQASVNRHVGFSIVILPSYYYQLVSTDSGLSSYMESWTEWK